MNERRQVGIVDGSQLTFVTPTKNKPLHLRKCLMHYAQSDLRSVFMIDDASDGECLEKNQRLIEEMSKCLHIIYRKQPGTGQLRAYGDLLEEVDTPYVVLAGDDDFFVPRHVLRCLDFLERNPDFNSVWGGVVDIWGEFAPNGRFEFGLVRRFATKDVVADTACQRLVEFSSPGTHFNTHSIQRAEPLRKIWRRCIDLYLDVNEWQTNAFFELSFNAITVIYGKQKRLSGLFHVWVRPGLKPLPPGFVTFDRFERTMKFDWRGKLPAMLELIAGELMERDGIEYGVAYEYAQEVWLGFFIPWLSGFRDNLLRKHGVKLAAPNGIRALLAGIMRYDARTLLKKARGKLGNSPLTLKTLLAPWSPYHRDFIPIYRLLTAPVHRG